MIRRVGGKIVAALAVLALAPSMPAFAGPVVGPAIDPATLNRTINVGESFTITKTVILGPGSAVSTVDVFFLVDNTGSMGGVINTAKARATDILNAITGGDPRFAGVSTQFGVGTYDGDPVEGNLVRGGACLSRAYCLNQAITNDKVATQNAINTLAAGGGGDGPEANLYALHQVAKSGVAVPTPPAYCAARGDAGCSSGEVTGWRATAGKVIVWFGDVPGHQDTLSLSQTISALTSEGIKIVGMNSSGAGGVIDQNFADGKDAGNQASTIIAATGGTLVNNFTALSSDAAVDAIVSAIASSTSTIDLTLINDLVSGGLMVSYACTDALGCDDVPAGESREFSMTVKGLAPGVYSFKTFAPGVDAFEADSITVRGDTPGVPTPGAFGLFALALSAVAANRRRKIA